MNGNFDDAIFKWASEKKDEINKGIIANDSKYTLLLSLLDTLSTWAFPHEKDNRKRFVKLIDEYSDWNLKDRISLVQLQYLMEKIKIQDQPDYDKLNKDVSGRLSKWEYGKVHRSADVDPLLSDFDRYKNDLIRPLIQAVRYPFLLWVMRNWSVHSFRQHGFNISSDQSSPYYLGGSDINDRNKNYWILTIPPLVISSLIDNCATKLKEYFKKHPIDPDKQIPLLDNCWLSVRDTKSLQNKIDRLLTASSTK
ncbi:MAG: hypothetical protein HY811_08050 [Planctomycetes bacterium]|nr:hypothetical protein [Planctomycetota bacterium]